MPKIVRGEAEPSEWETTKRLPGKRHARLVSHYLPGQPEVSELVTGGLEETLKFSVD